MNRLASLVAVAVLLGAGALSVSPLPTPGTSATQSPWTPVTSIPSVKTVSPAPGEVAAAKRAAADYTIALYTDDIERLVELATPAHASELTEPSASGRPATHPSRRLVRVAAVQAEDFRGGMALLQVLVERNPRTERPAVTGDLQLVSLVMLRGTDGWRVDEASF